MRSKTNAARAMIFGGALMVAGAVALPSQAAVVNDLLEGKAKWPGPQVTYSGPPIEMTYSNPWPPPSALNRTVPKAIKMLERITNGKIKVNAQIGGTLVKWPEGYRKISAGTSDFGACYASMERGMTGQHVFELPFVGTENPAAGTRMVAEVQHKYFKPEFEKRGVLPAFTVQTGTGTNLLTREPVTSLEDLQGKSILVTTRADVGIIKALGGQPVFSTPRDLPSKIGTADGIWWLDATIFPFKLGKHFKHRTAVFAKQTVVEHCVNPKWYSKLPADLKKVFNVWAQFYVQALAQVSTMQMVNMDKIQKAFNMEFHNLSDAERKRWEAKLQPIINSWKEQASKQGYPADKIINDIQSTADRLESKSPDEIASMTVNQPVNGYLE